MMYSRGSPRRLGRGKAWHYAAFVTAAAGMLAAGGVGFATPGVSSGASNDTWSLTLGSMTEQYISGDPAGYALTGTSSGPATLTGSSTNESSSTTTVVFQPNLTVQITVPSTIDVSTNTYHLDAAITTVPTGIPSGVNYSLRDISQVSADDSTNLTDLSNGGDAEYQKLLNYQNYFVDATALGSTSTQLSYFLGTADNSSVSELAVTTNWSAWDLLMEIPADTTIPVGQYTGAVTITGVLNSAALS